MMRSLRRLSVIPLGATLSAILLLLATQIAASQPLPTTLAFSTFPAPPAAITPGAMETFVWQIVPATTPVSVTLTILDIGNNTQLEQRVFPGTAGLTQVQTYTLPLTYTLPSGVPFDRYRARVDYYSNERGLETSAEAIFWATQETGTLQVIKFNDRNGNGARDSTDEGVAGVRFELGTQPQTISWHTDTAGEIAWHSVPIGAYTVTETLSPGWMTTTPFQLTPTVTAHLTTTLLFGNRIVPGALEAFVYVDSNGNGVQDAGEGPYSHAAAVGYISPCGDAASGLTGATGLILWTERCVGDYTVSLTIPVGYTPTMPTTISATITSSVTSQIRYGIQGIGTLVALKFEDRNGNGARDSGELALDGINMIYTGALSSGTGATVGGMVVWPHLPAGQYAVSEIVPVSVRATTSTTLPVAFQAGQTVTATFGNQMLGTLLVRVFDDKNGNGLWDVDDAALPGATISWINEWGMTDSAVVTGTGVLTWAGQPAGAYTVTQTLLPGHVSTTAQTQSGVVSWNTTATIHFGQQIIARCVQGYKVDDTHLGVAGWQIRAQYADGTGPIYAATTDTTGFFHFPPLAYGMYRFWEVAQNGWEPVTAPDFDVPILEPGHQCLTIRFKNRQVTPVPVPTGLSFHNNLPYVGRAMTPTPTPGATPVGAGCVTGRKIDLLNVGLPGFIFHLTALAGGPTRTAVSDGFGHFRFDGVPAGAYVVEEPPVLGWLPLTSPAVNINVVAGSACTAVQFQNRQATPTPTPTATNTLTPNLTPTPTLSPTPAPPVRGVVYPNGLAVNPQTNAVFVGSKTTASVYKIDGAANIVVGQWPAGREPFGVAVSRATGKVYAANYVSNTVSIFDGTTGITLATVDLGGRGYREPAMVAIDESANRVYVTLHGSGRVAVIDGAANTLLTTLESSGGAFGVAVYPALQRLYVSNRDAGFVSVFNVATNTRLWLQNIYPGGMPYAIALDATRGRLYILYALADSSPDRVAVYDVTASGSSFVADIHVGNGGEFGGTGIAVNPTTGHVFVANSAANSMTVFDGTSLAVLATVPTGSAPGMIGVNPVTNLVYIGNRLSDSVQIYHDAASALRARR